MAGAGAGADQVPPAAAQAGVSAPGDEEWRDWAGGLPAEVLAQVAATVVAQTEAGFAVERKTGNPTFWTEKEIQKMIARRKRDGNCLFVFARVCKGWRKAQLKVGGPLRTRLVSDVLLPGNVALAKWVLAEGCPREYDVNGFGMVHYAASFGHLELVKWLCGEGGFAMNEGVMFDAVRSGNLELVQYLRGEGCPWSNNACDWAIDLGYAEMLRWARENGCVWHPLTRDRAAAELGYTDDFGNLELDSDEYFG